MTLPEITASYIGLRSECVHALIQIGFIGRASLAPTLFSIKNFAENR